MAKRHARIETVRNADGTFHLRMRSANGRIRWHTETLTGRQVKRALESIRKDNRQDLNAANSACACAGCERELERL